MRLQVLGRFIPKHLQKDNFQDYLSLKIIYLCKKHYAGQNNLYGEEMTDKAVERYMSALIESSFVYECKRFDIKGKQHLKTLGKYYLVDVGLRRMPLGSRVFDAGRILENIVYLELLRRQKKVYIGKRIIRRLTRILPLTTMASKESMP